MLLLHVELGDLSGADQADIRQHVALGELVARKRSVENQHAKVEEHQGDHEGVALLWGHPHSQRA
jgi:hypothetical protein